MKWYKRDPTAALEGMIGLSGEERGYYNTLIDLLYARAPHHDVKDVLVVKAMAEPPQVWRRIKARLIAKGKVRQDADGNLHANRVETEVKLAVNRMDKHRVSGTTSAKINGLRGTQPQPYRKKGNSMGKSSKVSSAQPNTNYRDPGVEYRSPPRTKSDNVLTPLPDKQAKAKP